MKNPTNIANGEFTKKAFLNYLKAGIALAPMAKGIYDAAQENEDETGIFRGEHVTKGIAGSVGLTAGHLLGKAVTGGMGGGPSNTAAAPVPFYQKGTIPKPALSTKIDGSSSEIMNPPVPNPTVSSAPAVSNLTKGPMPDLDKIPGQPTYTRNKLRGT